MKYKVQICLLAVICFSFQVQAMDKVSSGIIKSKDSVKTITADITGVTKLYLTVLNGGDGGRNDNAVWGNPVLIREDGTKKSLMSFKTPRGLYGRNPKANKTNKGKALKIGKKPFKRGLYVRSTSLIGYS